MFNSIHQKKKCINYRGKTCIDDEVIGTDYLLHLPKAELNTKNLTDRRRARFSASDGAFFKTTFPVFEYFIEYIIERNCCEHGNACLNSVSSNTKNRLRRRLDAALVFNSIYKLPSVPSDGIKRVNCIF